MKTHANEIIAICGIAALIFAGISFLYARKTLIITEKSFKSYIERTRPKFIYKMEASIDCKNPKRNNRFALSSEIVGQSIALNPWLYVECVLLQSNNAKTLKITDFQLDTMNPFDKDRNNFSISRKETELRDLIYQRIIDHNPICFKKRKIEKFIVYMTYESVDNIPYNDKQSNLHREFNITYKNHIGVIE